MISDGFKLPALHNTQSDLEEVTLNLGVGGGGWPERKGGTLKWCGGIGRTPLLQQFIDY